MKFKLLAYITGILVAAALTIPSPLAAQTHHHYKLVDLGTLGGPSAYKSVNAPGYQIINNIGVVSFTADTLQGDPNSANPSLCFEPDCFVAHATRWKNGQITDLGALPGNGNGSASGAINASGWAAGQSENGVIDPVSGLPEVRAVLWTQKEIIDLGTFGGNWSLAQTLNDVGQVVGFATNIIPDPFAPFVGGTQTRAFLWQNGVLQDLGTLGGPDAQAFSINKVGQVAGFSFTNATPNKTTGVPTIHPFLWQNGTMLDLGTLGGTYAGPGSCSFLFFLTPLCKAKRSNPFYEGSLLVNNLGQVIGTSNLAGDEAFHPFLWDQGSMTDLGTLGGNNGTAIWLTDTGEVVGEADLPIRPSDCTD